MTRTSKLLALLLAAIPAMAAPTQHKVCTPGGTTTNTCTISGVTSGGTILVTVIAYGFGSITGVTGGGTYASLGVASSDSTSTVNTDTWCGTGITAGTTSISVTTSVSFSGHGQILITELPSVTCTLAGSVVNNNQASSATPQGGSITTSSATATIISIEGGQRSISGLTTANSFTIIDYASSSPAVSYGADAYRDVTSTGTYTAPQWTQSGGGTYSTSTFALTSSGGGGGGGGGTRIRHSVTN